MCHRCAPAALSQIAALEKRLNAAENGAAVLPAPAEAPGVLTGAAAALDAPAMADAAPHAPAAAGVTDVGPVVDAIGGVPVGGGTESESLIRQAQKQMMAEKQARDVR